MIEWNFDMQLVPRSDRVFLLLAKGEKGNSELAVGMICSNQGEPIDCYWTWGGPNSGAYVSEVPIAWAPLPNNWCAELNEREEEDQMDRVLIPPLTDPVEWDKAGKVHDWRNHVGEETRKVWDSFSTAQKTAIAMDAQEMASREEWD